MTLPAYPNAISFSQIRTEFGGSGSASMSAYRSGGARVPANTLGYPSGTSTTIPAAGQISFNNFHGASAIPSYCLPSISSNVQNYNLRNAMIAAGYSGSGAFNVTVTIGSGVYVWSDSVSLPAFDTGALTGGTITIINNGYIIGKGGYGSPNSADWNTTIVGQSGGNAINLQANVTIVNNAGAYIAGGGGGGGGNACGPRFNAGAGGGAGGGQGGGVVYTSAFRTSGAAGGLPGVAGANATTFFGNVIPATPPGVWYSGGGGGRILPGDGGAAGVHNPSIPTSGGGGGGGAGGGSGSRQSNPNFDGTIYNGFAGGSAGNSGSGTNNPNYMGGSGGGWGASGGSNQGAGGAGGKAIALNGYTAARSGGGTMYGLVS
jgi:hypothetical protein